MENILQYAKCDQNLYAIESDQHTNLKPMNNLRLTEITFKLAQSEIDNQLKHIMNSSNHYNH